MYGSLSPFSSMSYGDPLATGYNSLRPGGLAQSATPQQPGQPGQPGQPAPQPNLQAEYQGMIGGMNSMLQLGFASISLVIFTRNLTSIIKTTYNFLKKMFTRFGKFIMSLPIIRLIPQLLDKIRTESASMAAHHSSFIGKLIILCRVITAACIFALLFIKNQLKEDNISDIEKLNVELQQQQATLLQKDEEIKYQKEGFF